MHILTISKVDPNKAVEFIIANAKKYAIAKADRAYIEQFRKSKKALLMNESTAKTAVEREQYAYSHNDYVGLLKGLCEAIAIEERLKWELEAARIRTEIWRTQSANERGQDKALR